MAAGRYPSMPSPLAEQRRSVANVDQRMTLADALETQLAASPLPFLSPA
jgi:hypothetical protein